MLLKTPQLCRKTAKSTQKYTNFFQNATKRHQKAPKCSPGEPQDLQSGVREGLRTSKMSSNGAQESPRSSKMSPKRHKGLPKGPQEPPKRVPKPLQEASKIHLKIRSKLQELIFARTSRNIIIYSVLKPLHEPVLARNGKRDKSRAFCKHGLNKVSSLLCSI